MKKHDEQHICPQCDGQNVKYGPIELKFDRNAFKSRAYVCQDCGNYLTSTRVEKEIEEWAKGLGTNFHQYQPAVSRTIYSGLEKLSQEHGVKPAVMAKILTTVYLERSRNTKGYVGLKKFILSSKTFEKLSSGEKERISVPVKYEIYKEVNEFAQVWDLRRETEVFVEAINFCVILLCFCDKLIEELQAEIKKLKELIAVKENAPHIREVIESDVRYIAKAA